MLVILGLILLNTIAEFYFCHFSVWILIAIIGRILFSLRMIGVVVKIKTLLILEISAIVCKMIWDFLWKKGNIPWINIGLFILFGAISIGIMLIDNLFYVYVTEDDVEYYAEEEAKKQREKEKEKQLEEKRRAKQQAKKPKRLGLSKRRKHSK